MISSWTNVARAQVRRSRARQQISKSSNDPAVVGTSASNEHPSGLRPSLASSRGSALAPPRRDVPRRSRARRGARRGSRRLVLGLAGVVRAGLLRLGSRRIFARRVPLDRRSRTTLGVFSPARRPPRLVALAVRVGRAGGALAPRRPRAPRARAPRPGAVARGGRVAREGAAGAAARPARGRDPGRRLLPDVFDPSGASAAARGAAAFARRHRDHAAVVAGAFATVGVWHALLVAEATLARDPSATADPTREVAPPRSRVVTPAGRSIRRRNRADPDRVHHLAMRRLERHAGLREVLGAPIAARAPARALRRRRVDARRATPTALVAERSVLSEPNPPPSSSAPRGVGASRVRVDAPRGTPRVPRRRREAQRRRRRVGAENARPPRDGPPRRDVRSPRRA